MKKKLLSIMTMLAALLALLMVTAYAGDAVDPEPSAASGWRCTQAIYSIMDADGVKHVLSKTVYVYDDNGVLTESDEYSMMYSGDWSTEPTKTTYSYDSTGKCISKSEGSFWTTTYSYDSLGRLSEETYTFTPVTTVYSYDSQGRRASATITENRSDGYVDHVTYTYNSAGQCIKRSAGGLLYPFHAEYNYSYDSNGNKVRDIVDGSVIIDYEYEKVSTGNVSDSRFTDVQDSSVYYYQPVLWAVKQGITSGATATTFDPNGSCTRAQVVTFLYRAAGSPEVSADNPFTDVHETDYYYKAVLWAVKNKITSGETATTFNPNGPCTRAQVVTFLYRAAGSPAVDGGNAFVDVKSGDYYYNAVLWAGLNGVTSGTDATHFSPVSTCTRAQVVTFLYRDMVK